MNRNDIDDLMQKGAFPCVCNDPQLQETHISWVILCDDEVFKIKKPIHYDFIDFSTCDQRKYFCEEEVRLNNRLTDGIYLGVVNISRFGEQWAIGDLKGATIDYAVHMKRLPDNRRMDLLLKMGEVDESDVIAIADRLKAFHSTTRRFDHFDIDRLLSQVNAIQQHQQYVSENLGEKFGNVIDRMADQNIRFLQKNRRLFEERVRAGFVRDCHGDLHSRNIFLTDTPVIFDCIEFNADYRQIDLLNELAFFCMDLESFGHLNLSEVFFNYYNTQYPVCRDDREYSIFVFYKAYRANVRAKVNLLRAISDSNNKDHLSESSRYLSLLEQYLSAYQINVL